MVQPQSALLIVVADGERARFLLPVQQRMLRTVAFFTSEAAHQRSRGLGADRPGASFHSRSTARHSVGQPHDLHAMAQETFARMIAAQIEAMAVRESIYAIILAAPLSIAGVITACLPTPIGRGVVVLPHEDLVNMPDQRLWAHVAQWIAPAHLPAADTGRIGQSPSSESPG